MNISVAAVRNNLADALNRVAYGGERVVLERRGKGCAALVSMEDLALLEAVENEHWAREARRAIAEAERKGEKPIAWDEAERRMDAAAGRRPTRPKRKSA